MPRDTAATVFLNKCFEHRKKFPKLDTHHIAALHAEVVASAKQQKPFTPARVGKWDQTELEAAGREGGNESEQSGEIRYQTLAHDTINNWFIQRGGPQVNGTSSGSLAAGELAVLTKQLNEEANKALDGKPKQIAKLILGFAVGGEELRKSFEKLNAGITDPEESRTNAKNTQCGIAALYKAIAQPPQINPAALWKGTTLCWLCGCPIKKKNKANCEHILPALRALMLKGIINNITKMQKVFTHMSSNLNLKQWCADTANNYLWAHNKCNIQKSWKVLIKMAAVPTAERAFVVDIKKCWDLAKNVVITVAADRFKPKGSHTQGTCYTTFHVGKVDWGYWMTGNNFGSGTPILYNGKQISPVHVPQGLGGSTQWWQKALDGMAVDAEDIYLCPDPRRPGAAALYVYIIEMNNQLISINNEAKAFKMLYSEVAAKFKQAGYRDATPLLASKLYLRYCLQGVKLSLNASLLEQTETYQNKQHQMLEIQRAIILTELKKIQNQHLLITNKMLEKVKMSTRTNAQLRLQVRKQALWILNNFVQPQMMYNMTGGNEYELGSLVMAEEDAKIIEAIVCGDSEHDPTPNLNEGANNSNANDSNLNDMTISYANKYAQFTELLSLLCMLFLWKKYGFRNIINYTKRGEDWVFRDALDQINKKIIAGAAQIEETGRAVSIADAAVTAAVKVMTAEGASALARRRMNMVIKDKEKEEANVAILSKAFKQAWERRAALKAPAFKDDDDFLSTMGVSYYLAVKNIDNSATTAANRTMVNILEVAGANQKQASHWAKTIISFGQTVKQMVLDPIAEAELRAKNATNIRFLEEAMAALTDDRGVDGMSREDVADGFHIFSPDSAVAQLSQKKLPIQEAWSAYLVNYIPEKVGRANLASWLAEVDNLVPVPSLRLAPAQRLQQQQLAMAAGGAAAVHYLEQQYEIAKQWAAKADQAVSGKAGPASQNLNSEGWTEVGRKALMSASYLSSHPGIKALLGTQEAGAAYLAAKWPPTKNPVSFMSASPSANQSIYHNGGRKTRKKRKKRRNKRRKKRRRKTRKKRKRRKRKKTKKHN